LGGGLCSVVVVVPGIAPSTRRTLVVGLDRIDIVCHVESVRDASLLEVVHIRGLTQDFLDDLGGCDVVCASLHAVVDRDA
jgi:hypothetical protein